MHHHHQGLVTYLVVVGVRLFFTPFPSIFRQSENMGTAVSEADAPVILSSSYWTRAEKIAMHFAADAHRKVSR
jgi:hypothetical protein